MQSSSELKEQIHIEKVRNGEMPSRENVQHTYINGFSILVGNADISIVFKLNDEPIEVLHLSYTLAKTLSEKLGFSISGLEQMTENEIMTTDIISNKINAATKSSKDLSLTEESNKEA